MATTLEQFLKENNPIAYAEEFVYNSEHSKKGLAVFRSSKDTTEPSIDSLRHRAYIHGLMAYQQVLGRLIEEKQKEPVIKDNAEIKENGTSQLIEFPKLKREQLQFIDDYIAKCVNQCHHELIDFYYKDFTNNHNCRTVLSADLSKVEHIFSSENKEYARKLIFDISCRSIPKK